MDPKAAPISHFVKKGFSTSSRMNLWGGFFQTLVKLMKDMVKREEIDLEEDDSDAEDKMD